MPSLVGCIKKAGELLNAEDAAALKARAKELRAAGVDVSEAARQAVRERLSYLETRPADATAEPESVDMMPPKTAEDVVAQRPDMQVRLGEETMTATQALERAKAEAAEISAEAGWMQAAVECALAG